MAKTPDALVAMALSQVGYNRYTDPEEGTKYGRWYAKLTNSPWFGTTGVPYCAMFVSWCLYQLGIKCCGCPTASCTSGLLTAARKAGKLKPPSQGKRGDLVLFDWSERGYYAPEADHVGICEWNYSSYTDTIEGNVAGKVETRRRSHSCIVGFITPEFEKEETVAFNDVTTKTPHWEDIKWLKDTGISKGYSDGSYKPNAPLTRADAAAFLHRLYELLKK